MAELKAANRFEKIRYSAAVVNSFSLCVGSKLCVFTFVS